VGADGARAYILHVPSGYDGSKPVPLVVDFHGLTGSGSQEESTTLYKSLTDAEGVVSAYPTGKSGPMGAGWNVGPCCVANVDDVAFAKALVADVEKTACVDPKRVYAVGFSMGGGMTHYLGCHAADVFAAVAPAAFDLLQENVDGCKPTRPIPVIAFRSHGDTFVNYDGGNSTYVSSMPITFLGAKATFAKWADLDQCTGSPSAEDSNGCSTYSSCGGGVQVTLCSKQGGTHEQGTASIGWPLLKKYTLP
jgi:polyhydroxybutyrate depolymerase